MSDEITAGDNTIDYTGSIETYTVEQAGTYVITAYGASGGGGYQSTGGDGAEVIGTFVLFAGEEIEVLVGGEGAAGGGGPPFVGGGGGGGTFVFDDISGSLTALAIAGGGGGGGIYGAGGAGQAAASGSSGGGGGGAKGGTLGAGGAEGRSRTYGGGGGGGGYKSNGGTYVGSYSAADSGDGGSSFTNGGAGGAGSYGGPGGAGGGGGSGLGGGGGGGGYSGGGGGVAGGSGGGGGSLDTGADQTLKAGINSGNGLVTIDEVPCFLEGTLIATPQGERSVESLAIGEFVLKADGREAPIRWIGRRTLHAHGRGGYRFADPFIYMPIRIRAGALGENLPIRDLLVSADHGIIIEDVLVQAGALVNGVSVVRHTRLPEQFTFYHIELADHALILAEGTPVETFVDNIARMGFDNWDEHEALYPDAEPIAELPYPRAHSQRQLPLHIRQRMRERAKILDTAAITGPKSAAA